MTGFAQSAIKVHKHSLLRCPEVSLHKLVSCLAQNVNGEETGVQGTLICISLITSETELLFT